MCTVPKGGGKDSVCTAPTGGGKDSVCTVPTKGEKILVVQSQETSNLVQFKIVFIQEKDLPVGGRLRQFLPESEKHGSHWLMDTSCPSGNAQTYPGYPA